MPDSNDEFDDDANDQSGNENDPANLRQRMKKLEAEAKAGSVAIRKLAFVEAGIDLALPSNKYFVKGYDGEMTPDAIRAAALEAKLISGNNTANPDDAANKEKEKAAWDRVGAAANAGESSGQVTDTKTQIMNAKSPQEVLQLIALENARLSQTT